MSFLVKLQNFFMKNDPDRLYLAKRIARSFRNDEEAVMNRLEEIYSKGPKKLKVKEITSNSKTPAQKCPPLEINMIIHKKLEEVKDEKPKKRRNFYYCWCSFSTSWWRSRIFLYHGSDNSHETSGII